VATLVLVLAACSGQQPGAQTGAGIVQQPGRAASEVGGLAPSQPGQTLPGSGQAASAEPASDQTLVIGIAGEVRGFSTLNGLQNKYVEDFVVGNLFLQDEQGHWLPALAAESPSREKGTWTLNPDGTSESILRIRRGVKWHDGVEFTVHDLIFARTVALDREIPYEGRSQPGRILRMEPLDDYTVKVTYRVWEPEADSVDAQNQWPMPRHILEEVYNTDKQRFINHPYWNVGFVGLGPYKIVNFVLGSHMDLTANDEYVLGKPKIKNITIRFFQDPNVLVAALLSGDVHMTLHGASSDGGLSMDDGIVLGNRWKATSEGKAIFHQRRIALLAVQMNPEFQRPLALRDLRVRQALLHAIDRQALVDQILSGFSEVAHAWLPADAPDYPSFVDAITRYDYDPARAQALLRDAGWQRGSDSALRDNSGQRFELEYRAAGRDEQKTATVVADHWKRLGPDVQLLFIPGARQDDNEWMAKFPGIRAHVMVAEPVGGAIHRYSCTRVPAPGNNWLYQSTNPGGYCDPEMERHWAAVEEAFPFNARMEPFKEMMRIALRDLPYLPLFFQSEVVAVRSNVVGVNRVPPGVRGRIGMHAYTWTLR
jgi:peptide/nickel transport system substrate-binding protein